MTRGSREIEKSTRIRELNDRLRTEGTGGQVVAVGRLAHEDGEFRQRVLDAVRAQQVTTGDGDDPYSEHDFGNLEVEGQQIIWKIDYYDLNMEFGSDAPEDPDQTRRVLSIMRAEDY
nr:DUF3768 domain-containing protein [Brucella intermedia]